MIKFRAWDKEEKEWLSIRTIGFDDDGSLWYLQAWDDNENDIDPPYLEDDLGVKWELLQSTGLKDKHGVEIYDKDIVRDSYGDILLIEWLDGSFVLTDFFSGGYDHCSIDDSEAYEIVGNQFEHPHLLEE
ncbi:hypothetical protein PP279_gp28 [Staphylococcus virus IME1354_01]|uniref:YopX protein domain-containing protein n=1 Tax=Staphylococcus virus IME1354_01 TaxID=3070820 RepID=A0A1W6JQ46_9CAUD|nr:hypothetical protein PP279_gp28 [Staphylococcus virus IME1354_01]ARM68360.1 hypothetical protein [Staphylococcus virus IME1354_01]MDW4184690.1 YopX family protein [Staphylococcus saprophyticus]MDW4322523.1 YopX family protein [Staphylococcus saprophyticus]